MENISRHDYIKIYGTNLPSVMEQTNVPTWTESVQEFHESTRPFWENKTTKNLVRNFQSATRL